MLEHYFGVDNVALIAMFLAVFFGLLRLFVQNRDRGGDKTNVEPF